MEANPLESIRNNVLATKVVADTAVEFEAKRFVLISTDKALNPKAVYGHKALCEWIVEAHGSRSDVPTRFVAVRFGNVLGSAGSVITIFKRQIAKGGPVTITHPEMTRYFMTIPEASSLVVQAGSIGGAGEIFVLDMGEPVGILEPRARHDPPSGKEPEREILFEFIGVRAGEKLHEELWGEDEEVAETGIAKIPRTPCRSTPMARRGADRARPARAGRRDARGRLAAVDDGASAGAPPRGRAAGRGTSRGRAGLASARLRRAFDDERAGIGDRHEASLADQLLVDAAEPSAERRVDGDAERRRLAVHRPTGGDDEVAERDQALRVDGVLRHDHRRQAERADESPCSFVRGRTTASRWSCARDGRAPAGRAGSSGGGRARRQAVSAPPRAYGRIERERFAADRSGSKSAR